MQQYASPEFATDSELIILRLLVLKMMEATSFIDPDDEHDEAMKARVITIDELTRKLKAKKGQKPGNHLNYDINQYLVTNLLRTVQRVEMSQKFQNNEVRNEVRDSLASILASYNGPNAQSLL